MTNDSLSLSRRDFKALLFHNICSIERSDERRQHFYTTMNQTTRCRTVSRVQSLIARRVASFDWRGGSKGASRERESAIYIYMYMLAYFRANSRELYLHAVCVCVRACDDCVVSSKMRMRVSHRL